MPGAAGRLVECCAATSAIDPTSRGGNPAVRSYPAHTAFVLGERRQIILGITPAVAVFAPFVVTGLQPDLQRETQLQTGEV